MLSGLQTRPDSNTRGSDTGREGGMACDISFRSRLKSRPSCENSPKSLRDPLSRFHCLRRLLLLPPLPTMSLASSIQDTPPLSVSARLSTVPLPDADSSIFCTATAAASAMVSIMPVALAELRFVNGDDDADEEADARKLLLPLPRLPLELLLRLEYFRCWR